MPKKLPEIIDNLDEFVEKLLNRIADESEQGRISLIATMITAKKLYNKPMEYWGIGRFFSYFRTRGDEVEQAIEHIEDFPDAYDRLKEIKALTGVGEWNPNSSYNYYLFVELIKSVPGYKPLDADLINPITLKVKNKIIDKIDNFIVQYNANQKLIESRKLEREATKQSSKTPIDNVLLFNNLESAQASAKENPEKIHFSLSCKDLVWQLHWIAVSGKAYQLEISDELITTLVEQKIEDVENVSLLQAKHLKTECYKARDVLLEKVQLHINPKNPATHEPINNESLISEGVTAAFILRGKAHDYSLYWVSTLGKINEISLDRYPQFQKWLNEQNSLGEEQKPQLKAYLFNVNTSSSLKAIHGMDEFQNELNSCLRQGPKTKATSSKPKTVNPLNMGLFADITKCLGDQHKRTVAKPADASKQVKTLDLEISTDISKSAEATPKKAREGQLKLENYGALSTLFGQRAKNMGEDVSATLRPSPQNKI